MSLERATHTVERGLGETTEEINLGPLQVSVNRAIDGSVQKITPCLAGKTLEFTDSTDGFTIQTEKGTITLEKRPPVGLERSKSGHADIPRERQFWVLDIATDQECATTTIPVLRKASDPELGFTAYESEDTRKHPFIPFSLEIQHPEAASSKTEVTFITQVFGHISGAARLLKALPEDTRQHFYLAAKNTDNVPKVVKHIKEMELAHPEFMTPLTYDDTDSGGAKIADRKAAVWWLSQNPELVDKVMASKIIISDLREESAWFKHAADCMNLPQIFFGSTYVWPQDLRKLQNLPDELQRALLAQPTTEQDLAAMAEVGLKPDETVHDWFETARLWKGGVRDGHAYAADAIFNFSLVSPHKIAADFDNCIIFPPRTNLETDANAAYWTDGKKRILVAMGSGDWTEREEFARNVIESARLLPNCEMVIVGPMDDADIENLPPNVRPLGYVNPNVVDGYIKSCDVVVIKPGHYFLEETAGKVTLVGPPDRLDHAVEISKREGSPRAVVITVEVMDERLTQAIEEHQSFGAPEDFSPLIADVSSPSAVAAKIAEALAKKDRFQEALKRVPHGGTEILAGIIGRLMGEDFDRSQVGEKVTELKTLVESVWPFWSQV